MAATAAQLDLPRSSPRVGRARHLIALAAIAAHGPLVALHLQQVWERPHYCFALFLLPVVAWLMWQRWPRTQAFVPAARLERLMLGSSLICLSGGIWIHSPYLATVSAIMATGFAILHIAGVRAIPALFGTWMLLWLVVPPPLGVDLLFISRLQMLTSQLSSLLLDLVGINHLMAGNVLHLPETTLFVDDACSGVHSLFALLGCTAVFAVATRRTVRRGFVLLVGSLGMRSLAQSLPRDGHRLGARLVGAESRERLGSPVTWNGDVPARVGTDAEQRPVVPLHWLRPVPSCQVPLASTSRRRQARISPVVVAGPGLFWRSDQRGTLVVETRNSFALDSPDGGCRLLRPLRRFGLKLGTSAVNKLDKALARPTVS